MAEQKNIEIAIIKTGTGIEAKKGDRVSMEYTGKLEDGTVFDSSIPRNEPFIFTLGAGQVIAGWELGIVGMKIGESRLLTIPHELAYGEDGYPGVIPPRATLIFSVTLLGINS